MATNTQDVPTIELIPDVACEPGRLVDCSRCERTFPSNGYSLAYVSGRGILGYPCLEEMGLNHIVAELEVDRGFCIMCDCGVWFQAEGNRCTCSPPQIDELDDRGWLKLPWLSGVQS